MTPELTFLSRLALIGIALLGLEHLSRTRPQLVRDAAFELTFVLMVPLVFVLCVVLWLLRAMEMERLEYHEPGVGRMRA